MKLESQHLNQEAETARIMAEYNQAKLRAEANAGRVSRIDPASQEGTVKVDVTLIGELPSGARPDLTVDGIIELERLTDVVYVQRPVQGQPNSLIGLFKLEPDGLHASRVQVKLGKIAVTTVEISEGLKPGDQVILSNMSAQDAYDRIQLN